MPTDLHTLEKQHILVGQDTRMPDFVVLIATLALTIDPLGTD